MLLVIIFIVLVILSVGSYYIKWHTDIYEPFDFEAITVLSGCLAVISFLFLMMVSICAYADSVYMDIRYEETQRTIDSFRKENIDLERAGVINTIIKYNSELKVQKELINNPWVGLFISSKVKDIPYIK